MTEKQAEKIEKVITEIRKISKKPNEEQIKRVCNRNKADFDKICKIGKFLHYSDVELNRMIRKNEL